MGYGLFVWLGINHFLVSELILFFVFIDKRVYVKCLLGANKTLGLSVFLKNLYINNMKGLHCDNSTHVYGVSVFICKIKVLD
jgi:hypothetical protein